MDPGSIAHHLAALFARAQADPALAIALLAAGGLAFALLVAWARRRRGAPPAPPAQGPDDREAIAPPAASAPEAARDAASPPAALEPVVRAAPSAPSSSAPLAGTDASAPAPRPVGLSERLSRTRDAFAGRLGRLMKGRAVDAELLEEIEELLFAADLGVKTAESLLEAVRAKASGGDATALRRVLRETILDKLRRVEPSAASGGLEPGSTGGLHVILVLGVNGSGKTTTIGKLAARHAAQGRRVVLGAGDTFRAGAIEQLEIWGRRVGCEIVKGQPGGDPAAVAYDTVRSARARGAQVAIIDTAGRLQTKAPLVEELRKIVRVIGREDPRAPHETLLVLDANTGQNAISQARVFIEAAGVTGLVLTKLDGTAKGGVLVGLADEFGIPVRYVGVGEGVDDLHDFRAEEFVDALFASDAEAA